MILKWLRWVLLVAAVGLLGIVAYDIFVPQAPGIAPTILAHAAGAYYWEFKRWPDNSQQVLSRLTPRHRGYFDNIKSQYRTTYELRCEVDPKYENKAKVLVFESGPRGKRTSHYIFKLSQTWYDRNLRDQHYFWDPPQPRRSE